MELSEYTDALRSDWSSEGLLLRLKALQFFETVGVEAIPALAEIISNSSEATLTRVWACFAVDRIAKDDDQFISKALLVALSSSDPTLRRAALTAMGSIKDKSLTSVMAEHLNDKTVDPEAWWEDDCTVSQAAEKALDKMGTAEAKEALESWRARSTNKKRI